MAVVKFDATFSGTSRNESYFSTGSMLYGVCVS